MSSYFIHFAVMHYPFFLSLRVNVVAFDFLGHGDSPSPNQPELYTIDQVCVAVRCHGMMCALAISC